MVSLFQVLAFFKMEELIMRLLNGEEAAGIQAWAIDPPAPGTYPVDYIENPVGRRDHRWWEMGAEASTVIGLEVGAVRCEEVLADGVDRVKYDTYLQSLELRITVETTEVLPARETAALCLITEAQTYRPLRFVYMNGAERADHIRNDHNDYMIVETLEDAAQFGPGLKVPEREEPLGAETRNHTWRMDVKISEAALSRAKVGPIATRDATMKEVADLRLYQLSCMEEVVAELREERQS